MLEEGLGGGTHATFQKDMSVLAFLLHYKAVTPFFYLQFLGVLHIVHTSFIPRLVSVRI